MIDATEFEWALYDLCKQSAFDPLNENFIFQTHVCILFFDSILGN
jgi:hypothetical protein